MTTTVIRTTARTVVPLILLASVALFLQGHNLPGGGFIGGVLATSAFVLLYVAYDLDRIEGGMLGGSATDGPGGTAVAGYRLLFAVGLALAAGSGLVPLAFELPFLTQGVAVVYGVPLYHELEFASALAFDVGVYCVVVGALLTIVSVVGAE